MMRAEFVLLSILLLVSLRFGRRLTREIQNGLVKSALCLRLISITMFRNFADNLLKSIISVDKKNGKDFLTDEEEETIETNLNDLLNLSIYTLPTLRINAKATEEDVAEIFVRVNSGGQS